MVKKQNKDITKSHISKGFELNDERVGKINGSTVLKLGPDSDFDENKSLSGVTQSRALRTRIFTFLTSNWILCGRQYSYLYL